MSVFSFNQPSQVVSSNELVHHYSPRNNCITLFNSRNPAILLSGPAGTGKSRACMEKLHLLALINPGVRGLIVRKTAASLSTSAMATWKTYVIPEAEEGGIVKYYGGSAVEPAQYKYTNGSMVTLSGMDKADRIMSTEFDVIYVQEAIELTREDWDKLRSRLRNGKITFQQIIADTNPTYPAHWLKKECDKGEILFLDTTHEDNPVFFTDSGELTERGAAYLKVLDSYSGVTYQRLRQGRWTTAEGVIYSDFDSSRHVITPFEIPDNWPRYWSIDFGFTNPFVCQWWAESPEGILYMYREIYKPGVNVEEHALNIKRMMMDEYGNWREPKPVKIITDHDAGERNIFSKTLGLSTTPANKNVIEGITATQTRYKTDRLFLFKGATVEYDAMLQRTGKPASTEEEVPGYIWDPGAKNAEVPKEQPLKKNDHGCDAKRYIVAEKDLGAQYRMRWL
ncbi:MAG TPA: phage terminase large subunit [Allocoleopsis sp.]